MYDVFGETIDEPDPETMRRVLDSLAYADDEHPDVSLSHESGWCLSVFRGGLLVRENTEDGSIASGRLDQVDRVDVLRLLELLAAGDIASIEALPWQHRLAGPSDA